MVENAINELKQKNTFFSVGALCKPGRTAGTRLAQESHCGFKSKTHELSQLSAKSLPAERSLANRVREIIIQLQIDLIKAN